MSNLYNMARWPEVFEVWIMRRGPGPKCPLDGVGRHKVGSYEQFGQQCSNKERRQVTHEKIIGFIHRPDIFGFDVLYQLCCCWFRDFPASPKGKGCQKKRAFKENREGEGKENNEKSENTENSENANSAKGLNSRQTLQECQLFKNPVRKDGVFVRNFLASTVV